MTEYRADEQLVELLLVRLERISVDSRLAHRASGIRGALIRQLEALKSGDLANPTSLKQLMNTGFRLVERAASKKAP